MKNRVSVTIAGNPYSFVADEPPEYMQKIAAYIDGQYKLLLNNSKMSQMEAAVLCSFTLCDETFKTRESAENMRSQLKAYVSDASRAKLELSEAKREVERLKAELEKLRK